MSLTNPNTVVTEQRLSEFYQSILPYLGGMPEMLANKFSKGDLYSTDEKMIGQFIDGKPLYQKTISCGALPNNTSKSVAHGISNISKVIRVNGYSLRTSDSTLIPIPFVTGTGTTQVGVIITGTNIIFDVSSDRSTFTETYVTLQYTKTTDSAISIGSDTDYSTEEKIIGTWVDSKPIYQKTITGLNIKFNWVSTQVTMASNVDALIDDVDTIIKIPHAIMENNSGTLTTCNVDIQNQGTKWNLVSVEDYYLKNITIQYTKAN